MKVSVLVRSVEEDDWPLLWPLLHEMGKTDAERAVRQRVHSIMRRPDFFMPVAVTHGELAGYAWAQDYGPHIRTGKSIVRLHDLFVVPRWRKQGAGSALFSAVKSWARERGAKWLQWQATTSAMPFYWRLGLTPHAAEDPEHPFFEIEFG